MNHEQIIVWLEEDKFRALRQHLGGTAAVTEAAQAQLDALYEQTVSPTGA